LQLRLPVARRTRAPLREILSSLKRTSARADAVVDYRER